MSGFEFWSVHIEKTSCFRAAWDLPSIAIRKSLILLAITAVVTPLSEYRLVTLIGSIIIGGSMPLRKKSECPGNVFGFDAGLGRFRET